MSRFKITISTDASLFSFWPFRRRRTILRETDSHWDLNVYQLDGGGMSAEPISLHGYASSDGSQLTVTADFNGGSRVKRRTEAEATTKLDGSVR